jgi:tetratricopeptide (TPR) repeat protein
MRALLPTDPRIRAGLAAAALLALVAGAYLLRRPAAPPDPVAVTPVEGGPAPSAQNVDPVVHARLMSLRREVEAAPADTSLLYELARMEHDAHQFEAAVGTYERLIAVAPHHRQAYLDLAQSLVSLARWDDARGAMERLLTRFPDDPAGLYNLGAIHANQGRYGQARLLWDRVAAQTRDVELARRASESLTELERLASSGAPAPAAAPALPPGADGGALPPGHPPVPGGGLETTVITGPPLPAGAPTPAPPTGR